MKQACRVTSFYLIKWSVKFVRNNVLWLKSLKKDQNETTKNCKNLDIFRQIMTNKATNVLNESQKIFEIKNIYD